MLVNRVSVSNALSGQDMVYDIEKGSLGVICQNRSELSKIGRVWSIIEPEILGEFKIFRRETDSNQRVIYQETLVKQYEQKILCLCYQPDYSRFIYGFHSGKLAVHNYCRSGDTSCKDIEVFVSNEAVLFLLDLSGGLVLMTTSCSLKGLSISGTGMDILWGGSLKARLQGGVIVTQCVQPSDTNNQRVFLGSDNEQGQAVKSIGQLQTPAKRINSMCFKKGNLFVSQDMQVSIYSYSSVNTQPLKHTASFKLDQEVSPEITISCLCYYDAQKIFVTCLTNGVILFWNAVTGQVQGAQKVTDSRINNVKLFSEYEVLMICTDAGEVLTLKFGDIPN